MRAPIRHAAEGALLEHAMTTADDILAFWFPPGLDADQETHRRQFQWWFGGGANEAILTNYRPVLEAACRGELDSWAETPCSRLALIIVLDQFSRTVWQGTPQAYAQDFSAQHLALEGLECGHYAKLQTVWQKTFFVLPLGHAEQQDLLERCVALCEALVHRGAGASAEDLRVLGVAGARPSRRRRALRPPAAS